MGKTKKNALCGSRLACSAATHSTLGFNFIFLTHGRNHLKGVRRLIPGHPTSLSAAMARASAMAAMAVLVAVCLLAGGAQAVCDSANANALCGEVMCPGFNDSTTAAACTTCWHDSISCFISDLGCVATDKTMSNLMSQCRQACNSTSTEEVDCSYIERGPIFGLEYNQEIVVYLFILVGGLCFFSLPCVFYRCYKHWNNNDLKKQEKKTANREKRNLAHEKAHAASLKSTSRRKAPVLDRSKLKRKHAAASSTASTSASASSDSSTT